MHQTFTQLILLLFIVASPTLRAQSGQSAFVPTTVDSSFVVIAGLPAGPAAGDALLLHQWGGAELFPTGNLSGTLSQLNGAGTYAIRRIASRSGDTLTLDAPLEITFDPTVSQVVVSPAPATQRVDEAVTALPFDGATGGIIFRYATDSLLIDAPLRAEAAGFPGGFGRSVDSDCGRFTTANNRTYPLSSWRGAPRGQSVAGFPVGSRAGRAPAVTGGGGGNDHNSGAGGGANAGSGGDGGASLVPGLSFLCRGNFPGFGGIALPAASDRLFFGGGGGTGHANNSDQTFGGNGGGLIVLVAPNIRFAPGVELSARGGTPLEADGDGAGGGGAGGSVLLQAATLNGTPVVDLSGGDGGNTNSNGDDRRCFGPGGGGGGGLFLRRGADADFSADTDLAGGQPGRRLNSGFCGPNEEPPGTGTTGREIVLGEPALAALSANITAGCSPLTVRLINESTGDYASVRWDLPGAEPTNSTADTVRAVYRQSGRFPVRLTLVSGLGPDTVVVDTIEVFPTPAAAFDFTVDGDSVFFSSTTGEPFDALFWDFGDGSTSELADPIYSYATAGTYTVVLTATRGGCANSTVAQVTVDRGTSVFDPAELGITLFPNPTSDLLQVSGPADRLRLLSTRGRLLMEQPTGPLSLKKLPPGVYLLSINVGSRVAVTRIVKQ